MWRRIAAEIGFDGFMAVWQILHDHPQVQDERGRVVVPSITTWQRHQRNHLIRTLAAEEWTPAAIRHELIASLGYDLSEASIRRIISGE